MGLLNNLLKQVDKAAPGIVDQLKKAIETEVAKPRPESKPETRQDYGSDEHGNNPRENYSDLQWREYFRAIIASQYPLMTVREDVPVTDIAGYAEDVFQIYETRPRQVYKAEWGQPYTFVLYAAGTPKGVVMLGNGHSHDENVKYLVARKYSQKAGLPYINFYTQMPNEREYVVSRLQRFLGA